MSKDNKDNNDVEMSTNSFNLESAHFEDDVKRPGAGKNPMFYSVIFILLIEVCERLAYYTFAGSMKTYLQRNLDYEKNSASAIYSTFTMLCYISPVIGGWLADGYWGRYKTIIIFGSCYVVGTICTTMSVMPPIADNVGWLSQALFFGGMLGLVALGTGGIKPNVSNFGADQFDTSTEKGQRDQESYFSYFYWCINVGAGVAYGYLTTLGQNGQEPIIPIEWGFFSAFSVGAVCMALCLVLLIAVNHRFIKLPPSGDSLRGAVYYLAKVFGTSLKGKLTVGSWFFLLSSAVVSITSAFINDTSIKEPIVYIAFAMGFVGAGGVAICHSRNDHFDVLENHPMLDVDEAKGMFDTFPMVLTGQIGLMTTYNLMGTVIFDQACHSNLLIGDTQLSGSFFQIGDCFGIIIFTPILDKLIYPMMAKCIGRPVPSVLKVEIGLVVVVIAMAVASILEYTRRSSGLIHRSENCEGVTIGSENFTATITNNETECAIAEQFFQTIGIPAIDVGENSTYPYGELTQKEIDNFANQLKPGYSLCGGNAHIEFWKEGIINGEGLGEKNVFNVPAILMSKLHSALLFAPYCLIGIAETMVMPNTYYISYDQCPPRARSVSMAFNLLCGGCFSNVFFMGFLTIFSFAYPGDIDNGHIEYFYYAGSVLAIFAMGVYYALSRIFVYKDFNDTAAPGSDRRKSFGGDVGRFSISVGN